MDCECEDGIPWPELTSETGRSCFKIFFNVIDSIKFETDPIAAHDARESCLKRIIPHKVPATTHLLCKQFYPFNKTTRIRS